MECTVKILGNSFHRGFYRSNYKTLSILQDSSILVGPNILSTFPPERSSSAVSNHRKLSSNFYEVDLDKFKVSNDKIGILTGNVDSGGWWKALPLCEHPRSQECGPGKQTEERCAYQGENKCNAIINN